MRFDKCIRLFSHYDTLCLEHFQHLKSPFIYCTPVRSAPFPYLETTNLISVPRMLPFPECHINGILQYAAFCVWLI